MTETEILDFLDTLVSLASNIEKHGPDRVAAQFQIHFPQHFLELRKSLNKLPDKPIAALLRK